MRRAVDWTLEEELLSISDELDSESAVGSFSNKITRGKNAYLEVDAIS